MIVRLFLFSLHEDYSRRKITQVSNFQKLLFIKLCRWLPIAVHWGYYLVLSESLMSIASSFLCKSQEEQAARATSSVRKDRKNPVCLFWDLSGVKFVFFRLMTKQVKASIYY